MFSEKKLRWYYFSLPYAPVFVMRFLQLLDFLVLCMQLALFIYYFFGCKNAFAYIFSGVFIWEESGIGHLFDDLIAIKISYPG